MIHIKIKTNAIKDLGLIDATFLSYLFYKQKYFGNGKPFYQKIKDIEEVLGLSSKSIRRSGKSLVDKGMISMSTTLFKKNTYLVQAKSSDYNPFMQAKSSDVCKPKGEAVQAKRSEPTTTESLLLNQPTTKPEKIASLVIDNGFDLSKIALIKSIDFFNRTNGDRDYLIDYNTSITK